VIDLGLAWDLDSLTVSPAASRELFLGRAGETPRRLTTIESGAVNAWMSGGKCLVRVPRGEGVFDLERGDTLWVGDADRPSPADRTTWNGHQWRGTFKVFVNPRGRLTLADRLPLETYLLGVVPGEIGGLDGNLIEAGKAQAVAARSYTLFYRGRRAAEGFDLFGTVEDQVYGPIESERPLATRCVQATRGLLALSGGFPIRANYCSTCGGISAEVWEAWPADALPYLTSHADRGTVDWCAGSPLYRWREEWTAGELLANVGRFAPQQGIAVPPGWPGELVDVRIESRSRSGRAWRLTISSTAGDVVIPAYSIRQVLRRAGNPAAILRSTLFKIDVRRDASHRALAVVASGAGSGHGVGLCQTGALGMARAGSRFEAILGQYYPGADLQRRY
jgi:stage II sporulation protein D